MEYVRLFTDYDQDPAVVAAGEAAELLFIRGIAYAGRAESAGFIPDGQLRRLCPRGARKRAETLVNVGLWLRVSERNGYQIRSWEKLQTEHDALAQRRRSDRERKAREREKSRDMSRDGLRDCPVDMSRDVTGAEERRGDKNTGTSVGTSPSVPAEPPADGTPGPAETIVLEWTDRLKRLPPGKVTDAIGREVTQMLREGIPPNHIREGLAAWQNKGGLGPGALPSVVHEVMNRPAGQLAVRGGTNGHARSTTDERVGAGLALAAKLRAEEEAQ